MKILVDMNLSPAWARFLSDSNHAAVHWSAVGAEDAKDREIMTFAADNGYVVLTHDLDFGAILAAGRDNKPSVIQIRSDDLRPTTIGNSVLSALREAARELEAGALVSVEPHRARLRTLPLGREE